MSTRPLWVIGVARQAGPRATRLTRPLVITALVGLAFVLPGAVLAEQAIERIVEREHRTEIVEVVSDDVCGDVAGSQGLRSGVFRNIETGHRTITVYEDRFHLVDVENGTYSYDFDDPTIPDVSGYHYASPFQFVLTKGENVIVMENQHEFLPGAPNGIRLWFRYHATWQGGTPIVEREFFKVTGCP